MARRRFPRSVYSIGSEPDPRFSLANERTFLAWIRTSLALLLAGVALEVFDVPIQDGLRHAAALLLVALGLLATVHAWTSWCATERSLRSNRPLTGFAVGAVLTGGVALAALVVFIGSFL